MFLYGWLQWNEASSFLQRIRVTFTQACVSWEIWSFPFVGCTERSYPRKSSKWIALCPSWCSVRSEYIHSNPTSKNNDKHSGTTPSTYLNQSRVQRTFRRWGVPKINRYNPWPPTLVIALDEESRAACVAMSKSRVEPTKTHKTCKLKDRETHFGSNPEIERPD